MATRRVGRVRWSAERRFFTIMTRAIWDLKTIGGLHPATLWGGLLVIASQLL